MRPRNARSSNRSAIGRRDLYTIGRMPRDASELLEFDRAHLWHPYASAVDPLPVFPVQSAAGVRIRLADGRELVDGMSSWWAAIHGYRVPELDRALATQLESMAHVMFGGLTHEPAVGAGGQ